METKRFKTTIKCAACLEKATPYLDEVAGKNNWSVDMNAPIKVLTVDSKQDDAAVLKALEKAGYKGQRE